MLADMKELQSQLLQDTPESRRLGDIQEVIQFLQKPDKDWDGYTWMELNELLNRKDSLLKKPLFREYATVRAEAQKASVRPLGILREQQRTVDLLDSEELIQHLTPALRHPDFRVLADSADMPELVKVLQGKGADAIKLRRELSRSLRARERWLINHQWPGESVAQHFRVMTDLLNKLIVPGLTQLQLLRKWPARYQYPLLQAVVEKMAAEKERQEAVNPFMAQLREKLSERVHLENLEFNSLCQYAADVTGLRLDEAQQEEMRRCFTQIKQEIKQRTEDSLGIQIDGLDLP